MKIEYHEIMTGQHLLTILVEPVEDVDEMYDKVLLASQLLMAEFKSMRKKGDPLVFYRLRYDRRLSMGTNDYVTLTWNDDWRYGEPK